MITKTFFAEPVMSTDGKLLGVELLTKFHHADMPVLDSKYYILAMPIEQKRQLLIQQLTEIQIAASWFRDYGLFCSLNVDRHQARLCAYDRELVEWLQGLCDVVRIEISEDFEGLEYGINEPLLRKLIANGNDLFLDDLGAGRANLSALTTGCYHTVKLDKAFYRHEVQKPTFSTLIKNIKRYCDRIIIEGVEQRDELENLKVHDVEVWGIQGYLYKSTPFGKVHTLI
ncbi:EAL domain-containing protein [Cronobacter sakazakii]|uniref:EAL domain-containing protein n=1 Tax=Cronobacter sakazakii TaxID=28141 RepID=UPI001559662A|nr:EAL domain-containing protein [Cronobacter sakazakii]EIX1498676.1 EAL domain-containing protein [Cronobacter sakazakii]EIX6180247.1 EAL domain-containing protein [Cronobacter sakazakii]EIX6196538.1 EAL domain-containing protein [Cronobacter sakazakii]EIX6203849.1 EAL domain-containing protein [Cronobacter sakazakii]EIX6247155.1 EAL domain-containing protein [Cronobacter sakazakii]